MNLNKATLFHKLIKCLVSIFLCVKAFLIDIQCGSRTNPFPFLLLLDFVMVLLIAFVIVNPVMAQGSKSSG